MNNTVITYYTEIPNFKASDNNKDLLTLWEKNWKSQGWNIVVLDEGYAKTNKQLESFDVYNENSLLVRESRLDKKYLWNCYLRWFAYSKYVEENGTCIWSDFDVFNCNLTPDQFYSKSIEPDSAFNGSLCAGVLSLEGTNALINNIKLINEEDQEARTKLNTFLKSVENKDINDMVMLNALKTFNINHICTCLRMKGCNQDSIPYNTDGSYKKQKYPLIHFHHGIFNDPNFLKFPEIKSKNRTGIVNYFFNHYLKQSIF